MEYGGTAQKDWEFWGDQLGPRYDNMRIVYNNVNGLMIGDFIKKKNTYEKIRKREKALTREKDASKLRGVLSALRRWEANVLCLAETQTAWELHFVREVVAAELRSEDRYATMIGSSSSTATCDAYKPGGTLTVADGNWTSRISKDVDSFKLGRWSIITIKGRNNTLLSIITAYRCCHGVKIDNVGPISALTQQETLLKKRGIDKSPQEMFIVDMMKVITTLTDKGHEIILNVDANELWNVNGSRIRDLATKTGLYDIAKERHGDPVPATYVRKNCRRRIDYMLCSEGVLKNVRAMGIANEQYDQTIGDHRPQYVDIDVQSLLQLNVHDIGTPTARKLRSTDPKCVEKYLLKASENFVNHNIFRRIEILWEELEGQTTMTEIQQQKYEAIDRDVQRSCRNAENLISSLKKTKYVWSPALDAAMKMVRYWKSRKKYFSDREKTEETKRWGHQIGVFDNGVNDIEGLNEEIKLAYASLKEVQDKDRERRVEHLNNLAEKYASVNDTTHEIAIRELMVHEEMRELFRDIRLKLVGARSPQLHEVWTVGESGEKVVLSDPGEVEEHLLHRNRTQLRQASNTPFADGELGSLIHFDGTGDIAERIVKGEEFPEMEFVSDITKRYIKGMAAKSHQDLNTVDVHITMEQYMEFWKFKRESTVTSPYGLHIGHFRSCLGKHGEDILDVHRKLLLIPFKYAFVPSRWAQTIQILLEKDSGAPWSHRLRIIELFDCQLNAGLQIIFRKRMVQNAIDRDLLHSSTYGSIPNRTAQDAASEKLWSLDLMRIKKVNGAIFDCDAKGCYDRIIAALQSITCRRMGVPATTSSFFAKLWRRCKHYVRTRHGTSQNSYMATGGELLYGIGQGNGAGPAFWLSNLVVMFLVMETMCRGMGFQSSWNKLMHTSPGLGYVDDVTLGCTLEDENIPNDEIISKSTEEELKVVETITDMGQKWEEMLFTNGGRLELKKCHWLLVSWKWIRGVARMKRIEEAPAIMKIRQTEEDSDVIIRRTTVGDAPRILGCHISANGRWDFEIGRWKAEGARFAAKIKRAKLRRASGEKIYSSLWLSKLRYISPVVGFTKKQSSDINNPVLRQCLPVSGYNRNFPRQVVHGPAKFGGMEWETLWSIQVLEKVKFFIRHVRIDDKLGKLLRILTESVQLQSGLNEPILDTKYKWNIYVETTWISSLKDCLDSISGGINTNFITPPLQRKFDRSLMEIFCSWKIKKKELCALNRCSIYLQVIFVSDVTDSDGQKIVDEAMSVIHFRKSSLCWARQVRPSPGDRKIWRHYLQRLTFNTNELITTLGTWVEPSHQIWKYAVSKDGHHLLQYKDGVQKKMGRLGENKYAKFGSRCCDLESGFPVDIRVTGSYYRLDKGIQPRRVRVSQFGKRSLTPSHKNLAKTLGNVICKSARTVEYLWNGGSTWKCATDGGLKGNIGTCGLVLFNEEEKAELVTAMSAESCGLGLLHSTREELRANLAAEILFDTCNETFGSGEKNEIEFICDSKSAVKTLQQDVEKLRLTSPLQAEMGIVLEIERFRKRNMDIKRKYTWVRSHQEKNKTLNADEKLNQSADQLATDCRDNVVQGLMRTENKQYFKGSKATLNIGRILVNKDYKRVINSALHADEMRAYLIDKYNWEDETFELIDWMSLEACFKKLRGPHKVAVVKLVHLWQPTGKYVNRNERQNQELPNCSMCQSVDGQLHYMECRSEYFREARMFAWKRFMKKMKHYAREETFLRIIWIGIQNWIYQDFDEDLPKGDDVSDHEFALLRQAYDEQNRIGWNHFLVGRVARGWSTYYEHRVSDGILKDGLTQAFGRTLVEGLWIYTLHVWNRRNELVHGKNKTYSNRDEMALRQCVVELYDSFQRQISEEDKWLFRLDVKIRSGQSVPQMIGWTERVLLCCDENMDINNNLVSRAIHVLRRICKATLFLHYKKKQKKTKEKPV